MVHHFSDEALQETVREYPDAVYRHLLRLPFEKRQAAWDQAFRETREIERRGDMLKEIATGSLDAALARIVEEKQA